LKNLDAILAGRGAHFRIVVYADGPVSDFVEQPYMPPRAAPDIDGWRIVLV